MTPNERSLITELFARIRGTQVSARDPEAEQLIEAEMSRAPGAAYALAQTVLVQDQALREAHERLSSFQAGEERPEERAEAASPWGSPGSLAERIGLTRRGAVPRAGVSPGGVEQPAPEPARGGGFLQGALQTAAGVAGGALLFEGVKSLFGGGEGSSGLFGSGSGDEAKAGLSDDELTKSGLAPAAYDAPDNPDPDGDDPDTSDDWTDDGFDGDSDTI